MPLQNPPLPCANPLEREALRLGAQLAQESVAATLAAAHVRSGGSLASDTPEAQLIARLAAQPFSLLRRFTDC